MNKKLKTIETYDQEVRKLGQLVNSGQMNHDEYYKRLDELRTKSRAHRATASYRALNLLPYPISKSTSVNNQIEIDEYAKNAPLFGIELEIESSKPKADFDNLKKCILENMPNCVLITTDGSLINGYELLFKPTSYEDLKNSSVQLAKFLKELSALGFRSHDIDTCGLHIHVSKAAFTPEQIEAINNIITSKTWRSFLLAFSRRKSTQLRWCNFNKQEHDRYHALNYKASSQKTIEFRLFRGTLQPDSFLASIELVNILVNLARANNLTTRSLRPALKKNRKIMKYLDSRAIQMPEPIKRVKRVYTPEELAQIEQNRLKRKLQLHNSALWLWDSTDAGMSPERAFHRLARNEPVKIAPLRITNQVKFFKNALFTPIIYHNGRQKMPEMPTARIIGRRRHYITSPDFRTWNLSN